MKKSKSSLFLMELIIVVLFFALTSAVCLQVFVKAHTVDRETKNINHAVMWGDNLSEIFYEVGPDTARILEFTAPGYETYKDNSDNNYLYFDKEYRLTPDRENAFFEIKLLSYNDERFNYLAYTFTDLNTGKAAFKFTYKANRQEVSR